MAVLVELVGRLRHGQGGVAWLQGAGGIGKSTVVEALRQYAPADCAVHVDRAGAAADEAPPALPWRLPGRPPHAAGADVAGAVDEIDVAAEALCATGPALLMIEDLQESDEARLLACDRLARSAGRLPLVLICTCRPQPFREHLAQLRERLQRGGGLILDLVPLPDADLVAVGAAWLGAQPQARLADHLRAMAGNPGRAVALLTALQEAGLLRRCPDGVELSGGDARTAALLDRHVFGDLPPQVGEVLRSAALLGPRFDAGELDAVVPLALPRIAAALSVGVERRILHCDGDQLSYRHEIVRQARAGTFTAAQRRGFHRDAALALLACAAEPALTARHLSCAGELPPAARGWLARLPEATLLAEPELFRTLLERAASTTTGPDAAALGIRQCAVAYRLGSTTRPRPGRRNSPRRLRRRPART